MGWWAVRPTPLYCIYLLQLKKCKPKTKNYEKIKNYYNNCYSHCTNVVTYWTDNCKGQQSIYVCHNNIFNVWKCRCNWTDMYNKQTKLIWLVGKKIVYLIINLKPINMSKLTFSDGETFDLSGELRVELRSDGWYVLGQGTMMAVNTYQEGLEWISRKKINSIL